MMGISSEGSFIYELICLGDFLITSRYSGNEIFLFTVGNNWGFLNYTTFIDINNLLVKEECL